jgi:tetratricopeptide (TPR) repeat protein
MCIAMAPLSVLWAQSARPRASRTEKPAAAQAAAPALHEASRALSAGDLDRASALAASFLKAHPSSTAARLLLAQAAIARDDFAAAYDHLRPALTSDPRNVDVLYYMGTIAGRLAGAELQRVTQVAPDSARAHQLAAEAAEAQDHRAEAEAAWEAALRAQPTLVDALLGLARLKRIRLECDDAIALYERAEALQATFDSAYGLAACYAVNQDDARSIAQYRTALRRDPKSAVAWSGLATSQLRTGHAADAIASARRALAIEPRMSEAYYVLGRAYQASGDAVRAKDAFARAEQLRVNPDARPSGTGSAPQERP